MKPEDPAAVVVYLKSILKPLRVAPNIPARSFVVATVMPVTTQGDRDYSISEAPAHTFVVRWGC
jgi:hypothetical protein